MNKTYDKNDAFVSNNGIYDALYGESAWDTKKERKWLDALLCKLIAWTQILSGATVRRLARVSGVVLSLLGILGIAGAMEAGHLSLWVGLLLCVLLVGVEYLCLRPARKRKG